MPRPQAVYLSDVLWLWELLHLLAPLQGPSGLSVVFLVLPPGLPEAWVLGPQGPVPLSLAECL